MPFKEIETYIKEKRYKHLFNNHIGSKKKKASSFLLLSVRIKKKKQIRFTIYTMLLYHYIKNMDELLLFILLSNSKQTLEPVATSKPYFWDNSHALENPLMHMIMEKRQGLVC